MTPEDKKLWDAFLGSVSPLKKEKKVTKNKSSKDKNPILKAKENDDVFRESMQGDRADGFGKSGPAKIHSGQDRALCRKIKKGTLSIEGRLDLHGYTQKEAFVALQRFIDRLSQNHRRLGIIITGKGQSLNADSKGSSRGVLRRQLPLWLADNSLFPCVISLSQALPEHGGTGAFYVEVR